MKVSVVALAVLVIAAFCSEALEAGPVGPRLPGVCCFEYTSKPLSRNRVVKYEHTVSGCSKSAVIFTTITGRKVCSNPNEKWVQDIVTHLKAREAISKPPLA